ncbi:MAG: hypothetical protein HYR66_14245 [Sphingobacteriales bacterium]|nr:hypothetical protein [Sphingobacteriales bacterium]
MRTILILAAGVWIGREVFTTLSRNQAREREIKIRKQLEKFIKENLPNLQPEAIQKEAENILK